MIWRPWREIRELSQLLRQETEESGRLADRLQLDEEKLSDAEQVIQEMNATIVRLRRQLAAGIPPMGAVSTGAPEFVMVGIARPDGTKRLIASRNPSVLAFGMTEWNDPPPRWKIHAAMPNAAFIDKPDYAQATAQLWTMWANADAEAARTAPRPGLATGSWHEPVGLKPYGSRTGAITTGDIPVRPAGSLSQLGYTAPSLPSGDEPYGKRKGPLSIEGPADEAEPAFPVLPGAEHGTGPDGKVSEHFAEWHGGDGPHPHVHMRKEA
jgi:hypothetical protein